MLKKVVASKDFKDNLSQILLFISKDSKNRANIFKNSLMTDANNLIFMPLKFRKSIYFEDEYIRDFIFKGYCMPYLINEKNEEIILLDIIKWEER